MKNILRFFLCLSLLLPAPHLAAEDMNIELEPFIAAYNKIKRANPELLTEKSLDSFTKALKTLQPRDHNELLFRVLGDYEKDLQHREAISKVLATWQKATGLPVPEYSAPNGWDYIVDGTLTAMLGIMAFAMVKGGFIQPVKTLLKSEAKDGQKFSQRLSNFAREKGANMLSKPVLVATAVSTGVMLGADLILDENLRMILYEAGGEDLLPIWFQEWIYLKRIAPAELLKLVETKIVCTNHLRLWQINYEDEMTTKETDLTIAQKEKLNAFKEEIEKQIKPNLISLAKSYTARSNPLMKPGMRPEESKEYQYLQRDMNVKSLGASTTWMEKYPNCKQITIEKAVSDADRTLEEISERLD